MACWMQFKALFAKNVRVAMRNKAFWAFSLVLPIVLTVVCGIMSTLVVISGGDVDMDISAPLPANETLAYIPYFKTSESFDVGRLTATTAEGWLGNVTQDGAGWPVFEELPNDLASLARIVNSTGTENLPLLGAFNFTDVPASHGNASAAGSVVEYAVTVMYNDSYVALPFFAKMISQALIETTTGMSIKLTESFEPLKDTVAFEGFTFSLFGPLVLTYALGFFTIGFSQRIVEEKELRVKSMLLMMGCDLKAYWLSHLSMHLIVFYIPGFIVIGILAAFGVEAMTYNTMLAPVLLVVCFGPVLIAQAYCLSFLFDKAETCQRWLRQVTAWVIIIPYIVLTIIFQNPDTPWVHYMLSIFPTYAFYRGWTLLALATVAEQPLTIDGLFDPSNQMVVLYIIMLGSTLIYFLVVLGLEAAQRKWQQSSAQMSHLPAFADLDSDVEEEYQNVSRGGRADDIISIQRVSRVFQRADGSEFAAVKSLSLNIQRNELFGLLGPNGAGKSTTIKMLSGALALTSGDIVVNGCSVLRDLKGVYASLGVCPQFDALLDELTGVEHLELYAGIKGIAGDVARERIASLVEDTGLGEFATKKSATYSGGTKRKLSLAIAFIGDPSVVVLDEPSSGLDPGARRAMWTTITRLRANRCILLTTHSMEEAEALCSRIGIVVSGQLKCLGSTQHLKSKFGRGFRVAATFADAQQVGTFVEDMQGRFPNAVLESEFAANIQVTIPRDPATLPQLFDYMAAQAPVFGIDDYSVSQATLEQVFISLAKEQEFVDPVE